MAATGWTAWRLWERDCSCICICACICIRTGRRLYLVKGRLSKIASNISGGALVTLACIMLYQCGIGHHLGEMIIGSIIPLVPGVAFTTAIRDIADEDYIAGAVRMLDALLVTFCIAMGVGVL